MGKTFIRAVLTGKNQVKYGMYDDKGVISRAIHQGKGKVMSSDLGWHMDKDWVKRENR